MNGDIKLEVGKRYLFQDHNYIFTPKYYEVTVLEISPSGKRVKLKYISGIIDWCNASEIIIVEEL